jgi:uncharacterized protein (TIGR02246 family)
LTAADPADEVRAALADFDRCFAAGDAVALAAHFAEDAQLLLLHRDPIDGRDAIRAYWCLFFAEYDPGAWKTELGILDVHGDRAYAMAVYSETLVHRGGDPSRIVHGRLVFFLRRDPEDRWRVAMIMNSHVRPVEVVPPTA